MEIISYLIFHKKYRNVISIKKFRTIYIQTNISKTDIERNNVRATMSIHEHIVNSINNNNAVYTRNNVQQKDGNICGKLKKY